MQLSEIVADDKASALKEEKDRHSEGKTTDDKISFKMSNEKDTKTSKLDDSYMSKSGRSMYYVITWCCVQLSKYIAIQAYKSSRLQRLCLHIER